MPRRSARAINKRRAVLASGLLLLAAPLSLAAQQRRLYRIGVLHYGGVYDATLDGLRRRLRELGLEEDRQFVFHLREAKADLKAVEATAGALEREQIDVLFTVTTSVTAAAKRGTKAVPIVFYAGNDPVGMGFVDSFHRPGGRLTGVHSRFTNLAAKRFELLKEMVPGLRRVVTYYRPGNPANAEVINTTREAGVRLNVEVAERYIGTVEELRASLEALRPGEADAFYSADSMIVSQGHLVIGILNKRKVATIFNDAHLAAQGGLASYGGSYRAIGELAAGQVERILHGAKPAELPVEQLDRLHLVVNLKTAAVLGIAIPPSVLARADEVIQ
jgi:putative ABC transport system substrate-binding protein